MFQQHAWTETGRKSQATALEIAVLTACRGVTPSLIRPHRDRLLARGKPTRLAMIATARWLRGLLHVMARDQLMWSELRVVQEFRAAEGT